MYVSRPIVSSILACNSKVAVLEGARAVGKTALAKHELETRGFSYYSLADPNTYEYARNNLAAWTRSLKLPAIIDEAQRIADLPLAIKELVDRLPATGLQVILTGSASINRKGLEGQNPLARRSRRFTLHPLTRREIQGGSRSIVDDLWDGKIDLTFRSPLERGDLYDLMALGGFPRYAVESRYMTARERNLSIRDDIDGVLGDTILPEEQLDRTIAHTVLRSLLGIPGGILNVAKLSREIGYDSRTINRYIGIFERRFLVHMLPNLRLAAHKQNVARAKVHPVDVSFSCELLAESGKDPLTDPVLFGSLLESFVVNQIVASCQWSRHLPDALYWRETGSRPKEVDLVLVSDGELIGVEVKASSQVTSSDFNGLKALSSDSRFKRGFVFYGGETVVQESENLWALPLAALWNEKAFSTQEPHGHAVPYLEQAHPEQSRLADVGESESMTDARLFLSYRQDDDDHLDGAIIRLADEIVSEYQFQFGSTLQLFVDKRSIGWGENWKSALDAAVDATTFIMPAVTPGYLMSKACRDELQRFVSRGEQLVNGHILSLIWQDFHGTAAESQNPAVAKTIKAHQFEDVSELRDLDPSDRQYKARVRDLVQRIRHNVMGDLARAASSDANDAFEEGNQDDDEGGLIERIERLDESARALEEGFTSAVAELQNLQSVINQHPSPQPGNVSELAKWCRDVELSTREPVASVRAQLAQSRQAWSAVYETTAELLSAAKAFGTSEQPVDLSGLRLTLLTTRAQFDQFNDLEQQLAPLKLIVMFSPRLRPLVDTLFEFINTVKDMRSSLDDLISQVEQTN